MDARIRDQIKGACSRCADEWQSGEINWLLDVITPNQKTTASVIANFKQMLKDGDLRLQPIVTRLVDAEILGKMGARQLEEGEAK